MQRVGEQHGSTKRAVEAGPCLIPSGLAFEPVKAAEIAAELVHRVHRQRLAGGGSTGLPCSKQPWCDRMM